MDRGQGARQLCDMCTWISGSRVELLVLPSAAGHAFLQVALIACNLGPFLGVLLARRYTRMHLCHPESPSSIGFRIGAARSYWEGCS
jgi:hypothetical protein